MPTPSRNIDGTEPRSRKIWLREGRGAIRRIPTEVRHAARRLAQAPTFTALAVLALALGIGATTALFSIVDAVLIEPLAYRQPDQLIVVREVVPALAKVYPTLPVNFQHFRVWQQAHSLSALAAVDGGSVVWRRSGEAEVVSSAAVSASLFPLLGVHAQWGRTFLPEEEAPGRDHVVVISGELWQHRFGGEAGVLGKVLDLDGVPHTIIGILPTSFSFPRRSELGALTQLGDHIEIFRPLPTIESGWAGDYDYIVLGRRRAGESTTAVERELDRLEDGIARDHGLPIGLKTMVQPLSEVLVAPVRRGLVALLAAVVVLLVIACVNLASLVLARVLGRKRELEIRLALGAPRLGLVAGTLAESLLVAAFGGVIGVVLAAVALRATVTSGVLDLPRLTAATLSLRAVAVAIATSGLTGILAGMLPLRQMMSTGRGRFETDGTRSSGSPQAHRLRELLVGGQVALACWLLVLAAMLTGSVLELLRVDRGFHDDHAMVASVRIPAEQRESGLYDRILERLRSVPGVRSAALVSHVPLTGESQVNGVQLEGSDVDAVDPTSRARVEINVRFSSADYFETLGIPLVGGRTLRLADRGHPVTVVSQRLAALLWPGRDPLGKRFSTGSRVGKVEVVGVVKDVYNGRLDEPATLVAYVPYWDRQVTTADVVIAASVETHALFPMVRRAIEQSAPGVAVPQLRTMADIVASSLAQRRLASTLTLGFALIALILSSLGIYGVVTHGVAARRREIGIRIALGSRLGQVVSLILARGLRPVAIGIVVGLVLGLAGSRLLRSLLFGFATLQAPAVAGAALVIGLATAAACLVPAQNAARTDPVKVLRAE